MSKQLSISAKPPVKPTPTEFLEAMPSTTDPKQQQETKTSLSLPNLPPAAEKQRLQRLAVDIPADLHRRITVSCAMRDVYVRDVVISILEQYFPKK